jgi:hypothetical protein
VATILDALDDKRVFAPFFPSPDWDAWRAFLSALYGLPMSRDQLATFTACTGRSARPRRRATESWVICGRRSGKSRIAALVATYLAALAKTDKLAPGEFGTVLVCAVDRTQAKVVFEYIRALLTEIPALRPLVVSEAAEVIELRHRVRVEVRSSSYRRVRGVTLLAAILDEVAFLRDEASALPDVELYRALKPALATTGGLILGISSPWAQRGLLWSKYRRHYGQDGDVLVWQADSRTMHPSLPAELVEEATEDDPESAAAEWRGQFRSDLESYVSTAVLDACTSPGVVERPRITGPPYVAFLDAAAGSGRDSFTCAVAHAESRDGEAPFVVVDAVREVLPPFDPLAVAGELARFLRSYGISTAQSDKYAGGWVVEAFQRHGVAVAQDAEPKSALYLSALPVLTGRRCDLLDVPKLRAQFASLERRRRAGGRDVVDHPPGSHDDVANCVAGVLASAGAGDGDFVLAANVAPADRRPLLDRDELDAMRRLVDGGGW